MSRRQYRPGVQIMSFFELFAHERMINRATGKPGVYYIHQLGGNPKPFAFIYNMQLGYVDRLMQGGALRVADRITEEAFHAKD